MQVLEEASYQAMNAMRLFLPAALVGVLAATSIAVLAKTDTQASDPGNAVIHASTPHDRLYSVIFDGDRGLAVGESGLVKASTDGGKSWTVEAPPTDLAMIDVASNGRRTIAVGQMGLILVREGTGPWKKVQSGTTRRLLQVDINKNGLAFIVGSFGVLLKSTDGGDTWTSAAPNWALLYDAGEGDFAAVRDEPTNYIVKVNEDGSVIVGGEYGQLMRSPDGGGCWDVVYRHPSEGGDAAPTLFAMDIRSDGVGFAVGQAGLMVRTGNAGLSWTHIPEATQGSLFAVTSTPDGHVVAIGQRVGLSSRDSGQTWTPLKALDIALNWYTSVTHVASSPAGEVIAAGHSGRIIRLTP